VTTYTNPPQNGTCFSPAATPGLQFAAPTCQTLGGNTYAFWWNDMGGKIDDLDYNDAYFTVSCTGATSNGVAPVTQIVLVK
jgi:hypothetical protein